MNEIKKYNTKISPLWFAKSGNKLKSLKINAEILAAIKTAEEGGLLLVSLMDASRKKTDKSPDAYLELVSRKDVEAFATRTVSINRSAFIPVTEMVGAPQEPAPSNSPSDWDFGP